MGEGKRANQGERRRESVQAEIGSQVVAGVKRDSEENEGIPRQAVKIV